VGHHLSDLARYHTMIIRSCSHLAGHLVNSHRCPDGFDRPGF